MCYFNDLICPIFFLSYSNILLITIEREINKPFEIILECFLCGIVWEFFAPIIKDNSTTDLYDILFYIMGGIMYYLLQKINIPGRRGRRPLQNTSNK